MEFRKCNFAALLIPSDINEHKINDPEQVFNYYKSRSDSTVSKQPSAPQWGYNNNTGEIYLV